MHLKVVPFTDVAKSFTDEQTQPFAFMPTFNTHAHKFAEIHALVPDGLHYDPPRHIYNFSNFVSVIARSRNISIYAIAIPSSTLSTFEELHAAFWSRGAIRNDLIEEIREIWPALWEQFSLNPSSHYFLRLDESSPKDSPFYGPVASAEDVIRRLCTSYRAMSALRGCHAEKVNLMPWDEKMDPGREFRCFVPPGDDLRMVAVSQYRWHEPFVGWVRMSAENLVEGAQKVLGEIVMYGGESELLQNLKQYGFTFDVAIIDDEVQLIEVNPFGAMSGCGSCLFHWLTDAKLLYGFEEDVEVRITMNQGGSEARDLPM